jgi:hypothetical protein
LRGELPVPFAVAQRQLARLRLLPHLFRGIDWFNGSKTSCSLFAVYEKDKTLTAGT